MVEKIIVNPAEVRGLGNIVSPKTDVDFVCHDAELTEATEVVGNVETTVYVMGYVAETLSLSVSAHSIYADESVVLTVVYNDPDVVTGETVTFLNGETSVGTAVFDSENTATLTLRNLVAGSYRFKASFESFNSNTVDVTVNKIVSTISLVSDESLVNVGDTYTLSGVLSVGSGASVKLYNGQTLVDTLTTGTGGAFTKTITATGTGITNTYNAVFEGNSYYDSVTSSNVSVDILSNVIMELGVIGSGFSTLGSHPFGYTGPVYVDWGDNTGLVKYTGGVLTHNYSTSGNYTVEIYGNITSIGSNGFRRCISLTSVTIPNSVTSMGDTCFRDCFNLPSVIIPDSVTSMGDGCFDSCNSLTEIVLLWDSSSEIVTYNSTWISGCTSFDHFLIPEGTTSLYTAKSYPSALLQEDGAVEPASIDLTGSKSILSYADSESCVLTATVLDSSDNPVQGVDVNLYNGSTLWDTLTTDSSGECTKTYSSAGSGDITFTAEVDGTLLTKTYAVEDCFRYDDASTDKTSNYSTVNLNSLTHSTDYYEAYRSLGGGTASTYYSQIYIDETLPSNYEISLDIWASNVQEIQSGICISDTHPQTYSGTNQAMLVYQGTAKGLMYRVNGTLTRYDNTPAISREAWYHFSMKVNGTSVTGVITDSNDSTVYSVTQTLGNIQSWKKWNIQLGNSSHRIRWKNLKIKPL